MFVCIQKNKSKYLILNFSFVLILVNKEEKELFEKKKDPSGGQFVNPVDDPNKNLSQAKARVLQNVDTFFYIGTEVCLYSIRNLFSDAIDLIQ
jgi:fucose permease